MKLSEIRVNAWSPREPRERHKMRVTGSRRLPLAGIENGPWLTAADDLDACLVAGDRLLAGPHPADWPGSMTDRLATLLNAGVRHFVDLSEPRDAQPYQALLQEMARVRDVRVTYTRFPVPARAVPRHPLRVAAVLRELDLCVSQDGLTYLHGHGPMRRTGLVIGCYLVNRGLSGEEALDWLDSRAWRHLCDLKTRPESAEQKRYILDWSHCRPA